MRYPCFKPILRSNCNLSRYVAEVHLTEDTQTDFLHPVQHVARVREFLSRKVPFLRSAGDFSAYASRFDAEEEELRVLHTNTQQMEE